MSFGPAVIDEVIPAEYRKVTDELFPGLFGASSVTEAEKKALSFADLLGIGDDFSLLIAGETPAREKAERRLVSHFRNNVELLIQKTWVEKADESHKEKLLTRVPRLLNELESRDYEKGLKTLSLVADELAYLLFGAQGRKGDFIEYAFRIDARLGLFWWYASNLPSLVDPTAPVKVRTALLIGMAFLASI